jgi:hypothetical protein
LVFVARAVRLLLVVVFVAEGKDICVAVEVAVVEVAVVEVAVVKVAAGRRTRDPE